MTRYFTQASNSKADDLLYEDEYGPQLPAFTVHEEIPETWTGLLDKDGNEIHRTERIKMGFGK